MPRHRLRDLDLGNDPILKQFVSEFVGRDVEGGDLNAWEARVARIISEAFEQARSPRSARKKKPKKRSQKT